MKANTRKKQYTIRGIPLQVDRAIRTLAQKERKPLNQAVLDVLSHAMGVSSEQIFSDLDFLVGSWIEDPEFEEAISEQSKIDQEIWK